MQFGIDIGSTAIKAVLLDERGEIAAREIAPTGGDPSNTARMLWEKCGAPAQAAATGYGRTLAAFAPKKITEITCHARGVSRLHPDAAAFIDVGGQDSKAARLAGGGKVEEFAMNDKCAAGTGSFLETIARRFSMTAADFSALAAAAPEPITINATCVVFAESEVVGLLAAGVELPRIIAGIHAAAAARIARLFAQVRGAAPVYFTGGAAQNGLLRLALSRELGLPVTVAEWPQFTGALGAALLAV